MRKFFVIAIPVFAIIIFILIMLSDNVLKKSFSDNDNVPKTIEAVIQDINEDKWDEARQKTDKLAIAWKKVVRRVQLSAERDEINSIDMNIARLRGAILAKDKPGAFMELHEAYEHYKDIGK